MGGLCCVLETKNGYSIASESTLDSKEDTTNEVNVESEISLKALSATQKTSSQQTDTSSQEIGAEEYLDFASQPDYVIGALQE